jgi:hypothetical protein
MKTLARIFIAWLPLAVAITGICLLAYVVGQQGFRQGFNDTQVQLAEQVAAKLSRGQSPQEVTASDQVDVRNSEAPFIIIYDKDRNVVSGNGSFDGRIPTPPRGVFDNIGFWRWGHTWQPDPHVRIDVAIVPYISQSGTGYVLAGREMRVVEMHIEHIGGLVFIAWLVILIATFFAAAFARFFS